LDEAKAQYAELKKKICDRENEIERKHDAMEEQLKK
jgi:hypothetical protein